MDRNLWNFGRSRHVAAKRDVLEGPRVKIARARQHISDLDAEIKHFLSRSPFRVVIRQGRNPHQHLWVVEQREDVPTTLAAIVGDAVHNIRSGLDHLACAFVAANGGSVSNVSFPVAKSAADMEAAIKNAHILRAVPSVVVAFRQLEPYPNGAHAQVVTIHELDRSDKHRLLLPVLSVAQFNESMHIDGTTIYPGLENVLFILQDGAVAFSTDSAGYRKKPGDEISTTFSVVFGEGQPLFGKAVIASLNQLVEAAENIIARFEGFA